MTQSNVKYVESVINQRSLTSAFPEYGSGPVPIEPYLSPAHFELEREKIFKKTWIKVGRIEQIPRSGDYFVRDVPIARTSALIVNDNGQVRAFHNMCSHRGGKLVWDKEGNAAGFICNMHGWTYMPDGSLRNVPDEQMFYDLEKEKCGLTAIRVDTWLGFIFVNFDKNGKESLGDYLGEAGSRLQGFPFDKATARYTYSAELNCNWKVALDAFTEAYHVAFLHGKWGANALTSPSNPLCQLPYVLMMGKHAAMGVCGNPDYEPRVVEGIAQKGGAMFTKVGKAIDSWLPSAVNQNKLREFSFELIHFFPNFLVHVTEGTYFTHEFHPVAPGKTIWEGNTYYVPAKNAWERFSEEYAHLLMRENWLEDTTAMEGVQEVLGSGAKNEFILHDHELLPRHTFNTVMEFIRTAE